MILPSRASRTGTPRFKAIGFLNGALVFSPLGTEAVSAISLRPASRSERRLYDEA